MSRALAVFVAVALAAPLFAGDRETDQLKEEVRQLRQEVEEIRQLRQEVTALRNQLRDQQEATDRLTISNQRLAAQTGQLQDVSLSLVDGFAQLKETKKALEITGRLSVTAYLMDVSTDDAATGRTFQSPTTVKPDSSDVMIDEIRLNFDATINPHVTAHAAIRYEDNLYGQHAAAAGPGFGDTDGSFFGDFVELDDAYILIHDIADAGVYTILGKQYFPFGNVTERGHFIRDSQARRIYETRDTGITLGWTGDAGPGAVDVAAFVFNGQNEDLPWRPVPPETRQSNNDLDTYGAAASYAYKEEGTAVKVGGSWINNFYNANSRTDGFGWSPLAKLIGTYEEPLPAYNLYAVGSLGDLWLSAEWVSVLSNAGVGETLFSDSKMPNVLTIEAAYTFPLSDRDYTAAVRYEILNDLEQVTGIETVLGVSLATDIYTNTRLSLEYNYYDLARANTTAGEPPNALNLGDGNAQLYEANVTVTF